MNMNESDFAAFERLHGKRPQMLLDSHPDGRHVALKVIAFLETTTECAAVWDKRTSKVVWAPEGVSAMAWTPGGEQLAMVHEVYERAADHPAAVGSPLQREFAYGFVLTRWPGLEFIASCALSFPMGWPTDLVISPRGDLAVVQWCDQEESGLEFIAITPNGPHQIAHIGLPHIAPLVNHPGGGGGGFPLNTTLTTRPVFSPDGRYLILVWQDNCVWWTSDRYDVDSQGNSIIPASPGGDYTVGVVSILNLEERAHHPIPLIEHIPTGWRPEQRSDGAAGMITDAPAFLDARSFTVTLPTGATRSIRIPD